MMASDEKEVLDHLSLLHHVEKIIDKRVAEAIEKHELENAHVLSTIDTRLGGISDSIKGLTEMIRSGFPDGDAAAHRRVHEHYIKEAQERQQVWLDVKTKVLEGAAWAAFGILAIAVWHYLKDSLK